MKQLRKYLQQHATLWVHDPWLDRTTWLQERLAIDWLQVKRLDQYSQEHAWQSNHPTAVVWEVTSASYDLDLQSIVAWRRRGTPTWIIASLRGELKAMQGKVRAAGPNDLLVDWPDVERLRQRLQRWFKAMPRVASNPWELVVAKLPGHFDHH